MGTVKYKMSKQLYDNLRYPLVWNPKEKRMVKKGKPLTKKEVLDIINSQFGLLGKVDTIIIA